MPLPLARLPSTSLRRVEAPEQDNWLGTFGVAPQAADDGGPWESVVLTPAGDESLTLSWDPYEASLRIAWLQNGAVRVDVHHDGVRALRIEDRPGVGTFVLVEYDSAGMAGAAAVQVWPSFALTDASRYSR